MRIPPTLLLLSLLLPACAVQHQVPYDQSAFTPYGSPGAATITGQAYTILRDNSMRVASGAEVGIMPVNPYTDEIAAQTFDHNRAFKKGDPRFKKYLTFVDADNAGNFTFTHLHPGAWYVFCDLPFQYDDGDGNSVNDDQWIYTQVTVKSGQIFTVKNWTQGS